MASYSTAAGDRGTTLSARSMRNSFRYQPLGPMAKGNSGIAWKVGVAQNTGHLMEHPAQAETKVTFCVGIAGEATFRFGLGIRDTGA